MKRPWQTIILAFLLGCAPQMIYTPYQDQPRISEEEIRIVDGTPERSYEIIGLIEARGSDWTSKEEMLKALKSKAHSVGADAIIDLRYERGGREIEEAKVGAYASGELAWKLPKRKVNRLLSPTYIRAKAIKYTDRPDQTQKGGDE